MAEIVQGTDQEVIDFVNSMINSGNVDAMKGIAETVVDLSDDQIKALLLGGSMEVTDAMIANLKEGSPIFEDIAKTALSQEDLDAGAIIRFLDADGNLMETFQIVRPSCNQDVVEDLDPSLKYANDVLARVTLALNLDKLDTSAITLDDVILEYKKEMLSNQNAPEDVVTPYLTSDIDVLRAKAFVHKNTDNDAIVEVMTQEDEAGNDIDAFKLAMIEDLNTDEMIQSNANIVAYLLGENQNAPVRYAMFKNYLQVVLNGGSTIDGIDIDNLIETFVK